MKYLENPPLSYEKIFERWRTQRGRCQQEERIISPGEEEVEEEVEEEERKEGENNICHGTLKGTLSVSLWIFAHLSLIRVYITNEFIYF